MAHDDWSQYEVKTPTQPASQQDDWSQYEVSPKKVSGASSPPILPTGLNPFQPQQPITNAPLTDPNARAQMEQQQAQANAAQQAKQQAVSDNLAKLRSSLPKDVQDKWDATAKLASQQAPDELSQPTADELAHQKFMQTNTGKILGTIADLGSKATHGTLQIAKGAMHLAGLGSNVPQPLQDMQEQDAFAPLDKMADYGLTPADRANIESGNLIDKSKGGGVLSSAYNAVTGMVNNIIPPAAMTAEFAPAIAGGEATGSAKAMFYLQGLGQAKEQTDQLEASGAKINPYVKEAFIQGTGALNGLLMGDLGENVFGKLPATLRRNITTGIVSDAIRESAGKDITADGFKQLLNSGAKDFADKFAQGGVNTLERYNKTAADLTGLNVGNFALQQGVNAANGGKPVFNSTASGLADEEQKTLTQTAPIFAGLGSIPDATKLLPNAQFKNDVVESVVNDPSEANVSGIKSQLASHAGTQGWDENETGATLAHVDAIADAAKKVPSNIPVAKKADAVGLIMSRDAMQKQLDDSRANLDPSLADTFSPSEQVVQDKIDQSNDKLRQLVTGKRTTYAKVAPVSDDGEETYVKNTQGGTSEAITPERYQLENMERGANVTPTPQVETINPPIENESKSNSESNQESSTESESIGKQNDESGTKNELAYEKGNVANTGGDEPPVKPRYQIRGGKVLPVETAKAIDYINHGLIVPEGFKENDPSARLDLGMSSADKRKATQDISNGNYETAPAKKLIQKVQEFEQNGEYPVIEGLGGLSVRRQSISSEEMATHFNDAKANKIGELSERQVTEFNKSATDLGITAQDVQDYERASNSHGATDNGEPIESTPKPVQQSENDNTASGTQSSGSEATQTSQPTIASRRSSTEQSLTNVGLGNTDTHDTRGQSKVEAEADAQIKDGYDVDDLAERIKNGHIATDTENVILAKHLGAKQQEISDLNDDLQKNGASYPKGKFDALVAKRDALLNDFQDAANLTQETRRAAARALNSGNFDVKNDYSLENMIIRKRQSNGGEKLSPEDLADVHAKFAEIQAANKAYEAKIAKLEQDNADLAAKRRIASQPRGKAEAKATLADERKQIADDFSRKLKEMRSSANDVAKASAQFLAAAAPYVAKMVANLAKEGVLELKDVVARVKKELNLDQLSDRDVTDMISGKYNPKPTRNDLTNQIQSLKIQAKLAGQIEDAERGMRSSDSPKVAKVKDAKIAELRQRLAELNKQNGVSDDKSLAATKTRLKSQIAKLSQQIKDGDFEKTTPKPPVNDAETLELRRKRDALKRDWEVGNAKKEFENRTKWQKIKDGFMNVTSLPRALKASLDFSAPLRHGLFASVPHPIEAVKSFKTAIGMLGSEQKYNDWMADLKASPQYDLMQKSGLYISDKSDPRLLAREEDFMSNLPEKIPLFKTLYKATERNYQGYLNALRTGVFTDAAETLSRQGYTFESNPEKFEGLAKVVNVLTGRGDIPDALGGKNPVILSNAFFSPRFMAARIHTLYLWGDPRLPKEARIMAAKDIGKTVATVGSLVALARLGGHKVGTNPNKSDFLKIYSSDGKVMYDISGGMAPYIIMLHRMISGKYTNSKNVTSSLNKPVYGSPTRLTLGTNFLRGRLSTPIAAGVNLLDKKDMAGQPYGIKNLPEELVPMSMSDIHQAFQAGGISDALKSFIPAEFGIGVENTKQPKPKP